MKEEWCPENDGAWRDEQAEIERIKRQEMTCKWCGVIHERGQNTLCPLTVAEARVAELQAQVETNKQDLIEKQKYILQLERAIKGEK